MAHASGGDNLAFEDKMTYVQRKRAIPKDTTARDVCSMGEADSAVTSTRSGDLRHVVDAAGDFSNDDSSSSERGKTTQTKAMKELASVVTSGKVVSGGVMRRSAATACSSQMVVAVGIAWSAVVALMLFKWLWFYQGVLVPLVKWLGPDLRPEGEPIAVGLTIVLPFVVSGLVFYLFRPWSPRLNGSELPRIVEKLRLGRRNIIGGRVDSIDVAVLVVFALVQVNTLAGKLIIDQFNGKFTQSQSNLYLNRTGRALGMNGFYAVLISIVLVARRSFVHDFMQLSSERAAKYHVWCGNFGAISLSFHGLVYIYCWLVDGTLAENILPCFNCDARQAYKSLRNFSGFVAQLMLVVVAFASLERVRRLHFRRFTLVHCLNVLFVVGTCLHYYPAVFWFVAPMLVYIMYRILSVFTRSRSCVVSARVVDRVNFQLQVRRDGVGLGERAFLPGQYVYIKVDEISSNEWHPITISSSPLRHQATLSLDIKVQGPFTSRLLHMVRDGSLSSVQVDGYYGTGIETSSDMVFIAGGSGMTPFLSVLEQLVLCSKDASSSALLPSRVWVVWTVRDISLLNAHKPLLDQVRRSPAWKSRLWLHCTSVNDDVITEVAGGGVDRIGKPFQQDDMVAMPAPRVPYALVFSGTVVGAAVGMAVVFFMASLNNVWWLKRLSLLAAGVLGAMAGASTMLWRSLPSRTGFERVVMNDMDTPVEDMKVAGSFDEEAYGTPSSSLSVSRCRPDIEAILREIHASSHADDDIRVLVSGPSKLQRRVAWASVGFSSPLLSVESRSFAI